MKIGNPNTVNSSTTSVTNGNNSTPSLIKWGLVALALLGRSAASAAAPSPSLRGAQNLPVLSGQGLSSIPTPSSRLPESPTSLMSSPMGSSNSTTASSGVRQLQSDAPRSLADMGRYIDGDKAGQAAPAEMINDAKEYLKTNRLPEKAEDLNPFQGQLFAFMVNEHSKLERVIESHQEWKEQQANLDTTAEGNGYEIDNHYRGMLNDLKEFMGHIGQTIPSWTDFRSNIVDRIPAPEGVERNPHPPILGPAEIPTYLTEAGGSDSIEIDGKTITSLIEYSDPDEVGRAIDAELRDAAEIKIGGTIRTDQGPRDPLFYIAEEAFQTIVETWERTENGKDWLNTYDGIGWESRRDSLTGITATNPPTSAPTGPDGPETGKKELSNGALAGIAIGITALGALVGGAYNAKRERDAEAAAANNQQADQQPNRNNSDDNV